MFSNDDLDRAVKADIFDSQSVEKFRQWIAQEQQLSTADRESFRLLDNFNDIFVVIASGLLLASAAWVTWGHRGVDSALVVGFLSWGLAEIFVLRRRMALPAIVLLITFLGSFFFLGMNIAHGSPLIAGLMTAAVAVIHWKRFRVPFTLAAGSAALAITVISLLIKLFPALEHHVDLLVFFSGIAVFVLAMYWDRSDLRRITRNSDVAFWLHLLAAPMIVHPIFGMLGVFHREVAGGSIAGILLLYLLLSLISLVIDRRAFMVSSLVYVLYALNVLLTSHGFSGQGLAIGGIIIGAGLLILTAYWAQARNRLLQYLPSFLLQSIPPAASK